jgi:hypothetical protein
MQTDINGNKHGQLSDLNWKINGQPITRSIEVIFLSLFLYNSVPYTGTCKEGQTQTFLPLLDNLHYRDNWLTKENFNTGLNITRTIKVICLSRFLNFLLSYNVTLISLHPNSAPLHALKLCVS